MPEQPRQWAESLLLMVLLPLFLGSGHVYLFKDSRVDKILTDVCMYVCARACASAYVYVYTF